MNRSGSQVSCMGMYNIKYCRISQHTQRNRGSNFVVYDTKLCGILNKIKNIENYISLCVTKIYIHIHKSGECCYKYASVHLRHYKFCQFCLKCKSVLNFFQKNEDTSQPTFCSTSASKLMSLFTN